MSAPSQLPGSTPGDPALSGPPTAVDAAASATAAPRFALIVPVGAYLISRLVVYAAVAVDVALRPGTTFASDLTRWDAGWYVQIATDGYPRAPLPDGQNATAFFPLFPLLARGVAGVTPLDPVGAAVVVALIGGLLATIFVWALARDLWDEQVANRAAALFAFFPASYVFSIPYSEGVMVALSAGSLFCLHRRRWVYAGLLAAAATAARPNAVGLVAAAAIASALAIRHRRDLGSLAAPLLAPLGTVGFMLFLWHHSGNPFVSLRAQRTGWEQRIDLGATVARDMVRSLSDPLANLNRVGVTFTVVVLVIALVLLWRLRYWALLGYVIGVMVPVVIASTPTPKPRFLLAGFPVIIAIASQGRDIWFSILLAASATLLALSTILALSGLWLTP